MVNHPPPAPPAGATSGKSDTPVRIEIAHADPLAVAAAIRTTPPPLHGDQHTQRINALGIAVEVLSPHAPATALVLARLQLELMASVRPTITGRDGLPH
jgi:hypothetical protein